MKKKQGKEVSAMIVYIPRKGNICLGPYRYKLNGTSIGKINELILLGAYMELESGEEEKAKEILERLEGPFREEFERVVDSYRHAKRIIEELDLS